MTSVPHPAAGPAAARPRGAPSPRGGSPSLGRRDPTSRAQRLQTLRGLGSEKLAKNWKALQIFWRARSRLYQDEILQEHMRLTTFFKLYNMCTLLHRSKLKILTKNRFKISEILENNQQHFANVAKSANFCQKFKISVR